MHMTSRSAAVAVLVASLATGPATAEEAESSSTAPAADGGAIFGYSALRAIGAEVRDADGNEVGAVHDIIIGVNGRATRIVVSVGGFFGIGDKLVVIPYASVTFPRDQVVLTEVTPADLKGRTAVSYPADDHIFIAALPEGERQGAAEDGAPTDEMQQYLAEARRRMQEWGARVDTYLETAGQEGEQAAQQAATAVEKRWSRVQDEWRGLERATGDAWDEAKSGFQGAWEDFQKAWSEKEKGAGNGRGKKL